MVSSGENSKHRQFATNCKVFLPPTTTKPVHSPRNAPQQTTSALINSALRGYRQGRHLLQALATLAETKGQSRSCYEYFPGCYPLEQHPKSYELTGPTSRRDRPMSKRDGAHSEHRAPPQWPELDSPPSLRRLLLQIQ